MWASDKLFTNGTQRNTIGSQDWAQVYVACRWIQFLMAVLSVLGSASIIICVMSQRPIRTPEPLFLLSVSDLLLAICWLIGALLFSEPCSRRNTNCYHLHIVEQVLYMASFFYTLNYMWNLYRRILLKYYSHSTGYSIQFSSRTNTAANIIALLSGLLPVLLMTPVLIGGNISRCQMNSSEPYRCLLMHTGAMFLISQDQQPIRACRVLHTYTIIIFLCTFFFTLFGITVLVVKARHVYRRVMNSGGYLGNQQRVLFRALERRMLLFPLIFILSWGSAVTLAFLLLLKPSVGQAKTAVAFYISQALTSASQGFFNSLVYGWTRLRHTSTTLLSRDVVTQTPLLRSQKKRSYQSVWTVG